MFFLASGNSRTTTLAVNNANELTSLTDYNGTTSYSYDELGRMISKTRGGSSAAYSWHYDDRLTKVNSTSPAKVWSTTTMVGMAIEGVGLKRTDPDGLITTYAYDGAGRLTKETLPWSSSAGYVRAFDADGNIST